MIKYIKGNLFKTQDKIIAHGCNCKGGFGRGIAGQIKNLYPEVEQAYKTKFFKEGWYLGEIQIVPVKDKVIINCATQYNYYGKDKNYQYCNYKAIEKCLREVKKYAEKIKENISIPKIGCGLANGDWKMVESIIKGYFEDSETEITIYSLE
jgi:O-acetyl-ADP-ribose deacetylase (regulator of RNase III)